MVSNRLVAFNETFKKERAFCFAEHQGSEPRRDSFLFVVRDSSGNRSPPAQLDILIEVHVAF